jgi:hypothetical protein
MSTGKQKLLSNLIGGQDAWPTGQAQGRRRQDITSK